MQCPFPSPPLPPRRWLFIEELPAAHILSFLSHPLYPISLSTLEVARTKLSCQHPDMSKRIHAEAIESDSPISQFWGPILIFVVEQGETFQLGIPEQWRE